jgi:alanyl-tRNA synthetase
MAEEQGVGVDVDGFAAAMALQKERSRAATRNKVWPDAPQPQPFRP